MASLAKYSSCLAATNILALTEGGGSLKVTPQSYPHPSSYVKHGLPEHSLTATCQWHHVAGKQNPTDLLTRGLSAFGCIQCDQWLHGPLFLLVVMTSRMSLKCVCIWGFLQFGGHSGGREAEESDYWPSTSYGFVCSWVHVWHCVLEFYDQSHASVRLGLEVYQKCSVSFCG